MTAMPDDRSLIVRRTRRYEVVLPARFRIDEDDRGAVQVSPAAPWDGEWLPANAMDLSAGGVGLASPVFLPRGVRIRLQLWRPGDELSGSSPVLDATMRIQRVAMSDRRPSYLLGTAFVDPTGDVEHLLGSIDDDDEDRSEHVQGMAVADRTPGPDSGEVSP